MEAAGNLIVEDDKHLDQLKELANISKKHGSLLVGQIGHPGRYISFIKILFIIFEIIFGHLIHFYFITDKRQKNGNPIQ